MVLLIKERLGVRRHLPICFLKPACNEHWLELVANWAVSIITISNSKVENENSKTVQPMLGRSAYIFEVFTRNSEKYDTVN